MVAVEKQATSFWYIDGKVYDLSPLAASHPGGSWVISESRGFDVTYMLQTNHAWSKEQAMKRLAKYQVANVGLEGRPLIAWDARLEKIQKKLKDVGIDVIRDKTPWWGVIYYAVLGVIYLSVFVSWMKYPSVWNACAFGLFGWLWGGFMQHEGGHSALSRSPLINHLGRYALVPWAQPDRWFKKHSVIHHQFTNTRMDGDAQLVGSSVIRHHNSVPWAAFQRFHILSIGVFGMFVSFLYAPSAVTFLQIGLVLFHYILHGSFWLSLLPYLLFGSVFMFVTQLNHIQEYCFPVEIKEFPHDFVDNQVAGCVDYGHGSPLTSALSIFLNYQTYHHLFPAMSHFRFMSSKTRQALNSVLAEHQVAPHVRPVGKVVWDYYYYLWRLGFNTIDSSKTKSN